MPAPGALDRRSLRLLIFLLLALAAISIHRYWFAAPPGPYLAFAGQTMGTTWDVKVASSPFSPGEQRRVAAAAQAALDRVNALMSTWDPASEISRFNASESLEPFAIAPETAAVLRIAAEVSERSEGAFDITVRPLVNAWGFGAVNTLPSTPTPETLAALRRHVGWQKIVLDEDTSSVRKAHPKTEIDLSAIAKGFGVDQVAEALEALGHHDYLVEVGGELRASGVRLDGAVWRVAIEQPDSEIRAIHQVLELKNLSMATSGDYRNFYEEAGVRLSHTIDPREGAPIRHALASVTVLHPSAVHADAWATALNVLGPEAGYAVAVREGLPAYFILREESLQRGDESLQRKEKSLQRDEESLQRSEKGLEAGVPPRFVSRATPSFAALLGDAEAAHPARAN
jgi:thiamine biosynthesis lipoprotein